MACPDVSKLAHKTRSNGLSPSGAHGGSIIYAGEWLYLEPHGHLPVTARTAGSGTLPGSAWEGIPRVAEWDPVPVVWEPGPVLVGPRASISLRPV